jgi:hypothetical protein
MKIPTSSYFQLYSEYELAVAGCDAVTAFAQIRAGSKKGRDVGSQRSFDACLRHICTQKSLFI